MIRLPLIIAVALGLAACTTPPSPAVLTDARLVIAGVQALDGVLLNVPGVTAGDITLGNDVLRVISDGVARAQNGTITQAALAQIVNVEINHLAPVLLADMHANATITAGVNALLGLSNAMIMPMASARFAAAADPRVDVRAFVAAHPVR